MLVETKPMDGLCTETDGDAEEGGVFPGPSQTVHLGEEP